MSINNDVTMAENSDSAVLFEQKVQQHAAVLFKSAYRLTGSRPDAEDLFQELLVKLYRQFPQWREMDAPLPWLLRVLHNLHIDLYRKKQRTHGFNERTDDPDKNPADQLESRVPTPPAEAENERRQQRIQRALARLEPEQRSLVTLHLMEGYSLPEVASILDTPLGTLKSRLHRCKAKLKKMLELEPFPEI